MSNAVVGSGETAVRWQHEEEEEKDGIQQALQDDVSSRTALEADPLATHQEYPSSKMSMEEGHADRVQRVQYGHVNTESMMEDSHGDRVPMVQHNESKSEKIAEEGSDDGLHRPQLSYTDSDQELQEGYGGGLHRAQQCDLSYEQTMEDGQGDREAETKEGQKYASLIGLKAPQLEKVANSRNPDHSPSSVNMNNIDSLNEHDERGAQETLAACRTYGQHYREHAAFSQDSDDGADQNIAAQGRPIEYSSAAYMAPFGIPGEHTHKNGFTNGTEGEHVHEKSTYGTLDQHQGGKIDLYTEERQPGNCPHKSTSGNGSTKEDVPGFTCDDDFRNGDFWGNVYDHTGRNNGSEAEEHEKMVPSDKTGEEDLKIVLSPDASSKQVPSVKARSQIAGFSSYGIQSAAMKNTELALRFGSAVFSLIAFSVIISTNEKRVAAGSTFYVKFSDYQAYNYLAALNLLSFLYSSGQLVLLAQAKNSNILSTPVKSGVLFYLCDQILAVLMVSSSSSAATASELSRHGLHNIWPPACSTWQLSFFCCKADVAVAISFVSFLLTLLSSISSGYHLSKLLAE